MTDWTSIEACPLCKGTKREPWLRSLGVDLVRCAQCGHRHASAALTTDVLAHEYYDEPDEAIQARSRRAKRRRFQQYLALLDTPAASAPRVLDVGCNAGELLQLFQQHGYTPFGVEMSPGPARHASRALGVPIWQGRIEECLPQDERFDVVTLSHVLEHIHSPQPLLERLGKALAPGGKLLIEVPNADDFLLPVWRGAYRPLCPGDHISFFDAPHLERLLVAAGFNVRQLVSLTQAGDIVYPSMLSAVDGLRSAARARNTSPRTAKGVRAQVRYRGFLRRPLRLAVDSLVETLEPAVDRATRTVCASLRGAVLVAVAEHALSRGHAFS